jgi:hypothetical protein
MAQENGVCENYCVDVLVKALKKDDGDFGK